MTTPSCNDFKIHAVDALANENLQASLAKLGDGFQARRTHAVNQLPEFEQLRTHAQAIKDASMANLHVLLEQFESNVERHGGHVHWAENAEQARQAVLDICTQHEAKTVTKGKSMVTEEIHLNPFLTQHGITPIETDLGEYILQLRKEAPSHVVVPAVHLLQEDVENTFFEQHSHLDKTRDLSEPEALVNEARQQLRDKFIRADVGITGANYLIAETGSSVIVTNEGNGDLTQSLARVHVVVTTIERVIPTLKDLSTFLRLLPRSATGQEATAYVTLSTGPKRKEDPQGPEAYHVVLLDNGRSDLLGTQDQAVLNCIRCGACMNHCPVYGAVGGHSYGWVYPGPIGSALTPALLGIEHTEQLPGASTFCGKCDSVCPVKIPLTQIMRHWREKAFEQKRPPWLGRFLLRLWAALAKRPRLYAALIGFGLKGFKTLTGKRAFLQSLPIAKGWTNYRNFPTPSATSLHAQIKRGDFPGVDYE